MTSNEHKNWETTYTGKPVTYIEKPRNLCDLEQMSHYKVVHNYIKTYLPEINSPKVIEVGCGGARNALFLAMNGMDLTCSDYSQEAIRLAQDNFKAFRVKGTFIVDDLLDSKIPENTYDCVMSFGLLEHFQDLQPVINSLNRILKPGGLHIHSVIPKKFSTQTIMNIITFPAKLFINVFVRRTSLQGIIKRSYRNFPHYENTFSWQEYCRLFEASHSKILACESEGLLIPFFLWPNYIGLGYPLFKMFGNKITVLNKKIRKSKSPLVYKLSQEFTIVARKKEDTVASEATGVQ